MHGGRHNLINVELIKINIIHTNFIEHFQILEGLDICIKYN